MKIDTLTKDPKNKTIKQVETKLFKKFNTPEYNKTPEVKYQNVFFKKDSKSFSIPEIMKFMVDLMVRKKLVKIKQR